MAGIGIIANPHSKLNKRNPRRQHLLSYIAGEQGRLEITNNLDELSYVARDFRERAIEILAINGGDGTISRTLTAFIRAYGETKQPLPKISVLRGGTMNMLADNLGIRGTPEQVLYRLIEAYSLGQYGAGIRLASLEVEGDFGFLFASGTSARFLEEFYRNKTGALGCLMLLAKISLSSLVGGSLFPKIVKYEPVVCKPADSEPMAHGSLSILAATVERLPLKIRLFPAAAGVHDKFQVLSVTLKENELVRQLASTFVLHPESDGYGKLRLATRSLTLTLQEAPGLVYTLDGEIYHHPSSSLCIRLGPPLDFLVV